MNTFEIEYWKCKRCGEIVDIVNKRCGCAVSPSPWEPVMWAYDKFGNKECQFHHNGMGKPCGKCISCKLNDLRNDGYLYR
jgi:hypothetical protein